MEPQNEQIAPEIFQAIIAKATESGLSLNDYLAQMLGLTNGHDEASALAGETPLSEQPFYKTATPEEWIREFTKWADSHDPNTPALTLEDVSRESIYSDR